MDQRPFGSLSRAGLRGQVAVGLLVGVVESCVGPTLGAAAALAAQGHNLIQVGLVMLAFGIGGAAPLLVLGMISREVMAHRHLRPLQTGTGFRPRWALCSPLRAPSS